MLSISIIIEATPKTGGEWHNNINIIKNIRKYSRNNFKLFIFCTQKKSVLELHKIGINSNFIKITLLDKLIRFLKKSFNCRLILTSSLEKKLLKKNISLIYFTNFSSLVALFNKIKFIGTVLDLCHLDYPDFPEIKNNNTYVNREYLYGNFLNKCFLVITDSLETKKKIITNYGINKNKIIELPVSFPFPINTLKNKKIKNNFIYKNYFFYPANFWYHKNHFLIIEAAKILRDKGIYKKFVFCGYDRGFLKFIEAKIKKEKLEDQIFILGGVSNFILTKLYLNCSSVVMPSFFGPTNMPPLEAWRYKKPLIYNKFFKKHTKDAALYIDPMNAESLSNALLKVIKPRLKKKLIKKGIQNLDDVNKKISKSIKRIINKILNLEKVI